MLSRDQLPNDIEQLKDIILEQQALIEQLQNQVQALLRHVYGQRSEKQKATKPLKEKSAAKAEPHGRNGLPDHLPREDVLYSVPKEQLPCPHCGQARCVIGEEISEQLDYVPGQLKVLCQWAALSVHLRCTLIRPLDGHDNPARGSAV